MGKDSVDHPPRLHDDVANSVAGLSHLLTDAEGGQAKNGFNPAKHISQEKLVPSRYAPIGVGLTLTSPTASVIGQAHDNGIEIYMAFASQGGLKNHIEQHLRPWLQQNSGWALSSWEKLLGTYEDGLVAETQWSLAAIIQDALPGDWQPAEIPIELDGNR